MTPTTDELIQSTNSRLLSSGTDAALRSIASAILTLASAVKDHRRN